ncbi:MAG: serine/threonine-protein kinase [Candidatus Woesearchaeota archaeon]|nr:serine/threonine-protein kinase [Candidatus Woesearchaeota archaeon]
MSDLTPYQPGTPFLTQFKIIKQIGSGGMATVYEIQHIPTGQTAALKLLDFSKAKKWDSEEEQEFRREAEALRSISHPNVVGYGHSFLEDVGGYGSAFHLLLELINGKSVKEVIDPRGNARYHFSADEIDKVLLQSVDGLDAAHERGIVHRDPTPHNIMLEYPNGWQEGQPFAFERVVVTDFGVARLRPHITGSETIIGKANYLAPEQRRNESTSSATDWYILAETAVAAATHREPPIFDDPRFQASETSKYDPIDLIQRATNIHPATKITLEAMLRENKKDRPQRADDVRKLLVQSGGTVGRYNPKTRLYEVEEKTSGLHDHVMGALEEVRAEKKLPGPAEHETFTTALAKPTGALMPKEMSVEALNKAVPHTVEWYHTKTPVLSGIAGAVIAGGAGGHYLLQTGIAEKLLELSAHPENYTLGQGVLTAAGFFGGMVAGALKIYKTLNNKHPPTRALAKMDEEYKERNWLQRGLEWYADNVNSDAAIWWLSPVKLACATGLGTYVGVMGADILSTLMAAAGGLIGGTVIDVFFQIGMHETGKIEDVDTLGTSLLRRPYKAKNTFEKEHDNLVDGHHSFPQVEQRYGAKARQTLVRNYATKHLEAGDYDKVTQVFDYITGEINRKWVVENTPRKAKKFARQEAGLLEDICLGLLTKGALDELGHIRTNNFRLDSAERGRDFNTVEYVLGAKKTAAIDALARDRLRSSHHRLYGRTEDDADVKQYAGLCRAFGMEPNLEKLTRALVPAPVEEARGIMNSDARETHRKGRISYQEYCEKLLTKRIDEVSGEVERQDGYKARQEMARFDSKVLLNRGSYDRVVEIVDCVFNKIAEEMKIYRDMHSMPGLKEHIEEIMYGLLNKGAWKQLADLRTKTAPKYTGTPGSYETRNIFEQIVRDSNHILFDNVIRTRLREVQPYVKDATAEELKGYEAACRAFTAASWKNDEFEQRKRELNLF